jgi:hypothetical protein|tara:strand:+ start:824 stop:1228 length:405 start_codon:yes stop_codon:yes gene_type:complete
MKYKSKYLLYIFYTGRNLKVGIVEKRANLDKRFNALFKGLALPTEDARAKVKFLRVYEAWSDRMIKTCEDKVLNQSLLEHRLPQADPNGEPTEYFNTHVTLEMIIEAIEEQTLCKLNLLYEDYVPNYNKKEEIA